MLENYGYKVSHAENAQEAFAMLSENKCHLILLDRTSGTDRITGFDIGGDGYLPKPYSVKELLSRVNALIRRAYGFPYAALFVTFNFNITCSFF